MAESDLDLSKSYGTLRHEPQPYVPSNPIHENDIERLLSVESEEMEGTWSRVKKTKDAEVWRREANEEGFPPITKAVLRLEDVPFKTAVKLMTDWKLRQEWDKTASVVDVLDRIGNFKVVYNRLKMPLFCTKRDVVLASLERYDSDQHCYILALRSTEHPLMKDSVKSNFVRAETILSGTIIRPVDDGSTSSTVTVITQMKLMGSAPQFIKNSYLACSPVKRMQLMRKFYLKCQTDADLNLSLSGSEKDIKMSPFISTRKTKSSTGSINFVTDD
ncbi:uncharacterized protein [Pocillopora verrucosa]|uniref:START domain-containing protein n=1 Tax=Pocillopora meandrina TaxID=46732 RepID=A0AAU9WKI9_9CNID|nr:uncharacterized protein LOC131777393 [Pocillopora verrucosa]CAH3117441.1 unnamed protein product [Pocillopora meandrina]